MKTLKEYIVNENKFFKNLGIGIQPKIEEWLKQHKITNYTINEDLTIDVNGNVYLNNYVEKELPEYIQFNNVSKKFVLWHSNIVNLRGCPVTCESFGCIKCDNLSSLKGCPKIVDRFEVNSCNKLEDLVGSPKTVKGEINCYGNINLKSLKGCPKKCKNFVCICNKNLKLLEYAPQSCKYVVCYGNGKHFWEDEIRKYIKCEEIENPSYTEQELNEW